VARPSAESAVKPSAEPAVKSPPVEPPVEPVFVLPSVVRQRSSSRSPPAHTVTVPPPSPSEKPRPAFTISGAAPQDAPRDRGPVFSIGDNAHVRREPAFGATSFGEREHEPGSAARDTREPHIS